MMAIGPHQRRRFSRICTVPAHSFDWSAREWGVREQRRVIKGNRIWIAEIGLSSSENVIKEVSEEACIDVAVQTLYAVRHKAKGPFNPDVRDFYKLYFLCSRTSDSNPKPGPDVSETRFFSLDDLPELCTDRVVTEDIERAFSYLNSSVKEVWFD